MEDNIPKREPTRREKISARIEMLNKDTGLELSYSKGINGFRLQSNTKHYMSGVFSANKFIDLLDVLDSLVSEMQRYGKLPKPQ